MTVVSWVRCSRATDAAEADSSDQICAVGASSNFGISSTVSGLLPSAFDLSWQNLAQYDKSCQMSTKGSHCQLISVV